MRLIYEHAERVLIWLGDSDPSIDDFFRTLRPFSWISTSQMVLEIHCCIKQSDVGHVIEYQDCYADKMWV